MLFPDEVERQKWLIRLQSRPHNRSAMDMLWSGAVERVMHVLERMCGGGGEYWRAPREADRPRVLTLFERVIDAVGVTADRVVVRSRASVAWPPPEGG